MMEIIFYVAFRAPEIYSQIVGDDDGSEFQYCLFSSDDDFLYFKLVLYRFIN